MTEVKTEAKFKFPATPSKSVFQEEDIAKLPDTPTEKDINKLGQHGIILKDWVKKLRLLTRKHDIFKYVRHYQGQARCPVHGLWEHDFKDAVKKRQRILIDSDEFMYPLVDWLLNGTRRAWSTTSLLRAVSAKTGEAAILDEVQRRYFP